MLNKIYSQQAFQEQINIKYYFKIDIIGNNAFGMVYLIQEKE